MEVAAQQLEILKSPPRDIPPGKHRVYLAPPAVADLLHMLAWGGFGLKARRTKKTSLLKMEESGQRLHPHFTVRENTQEGVSPNFDTSGFLKPDLVTLIDAGGLADCLVSPRSAKEYGVPTNGAGSGEAPESIDMSAGGMPVREVLRELDTGVYINNVWYLNYSDRASSRITGMTRYACLWVENGVIQAPLNVMRFDETIYRMFGDKLLALTGEREFLMDGSTYRRRSTASSRVPGALVGSSPSRCKLGLQRVAFIGGHGGMARIKQVRVWRSPIGLGLLCSGLMWWLGDRVRHAPEALAWGVTLAVPGALMHWRYLARRITRRDRRYERNKIPVRYLSAFEALVSLRLPKATIWPYLSSWAWSSWP